MSMTGPQVYENFKSGTGTGGLESFADVLITLRRSYAARAVSIKRIQERMESGWTGDGGAAAASGAGPLVPALQGSAENMERTFQSVDSQAAVWHQAANSVEPVPPTPTEPSMWDDLKTLGGASDTYEQGLEQHNKAAQHNVDVMTKYSGSTLKNSTFPTSYTALSPSGAAVKIDTGTAPSAVSTDVSPSPDVRGGTPPASPGTSTGAAPFVPGGPGAGRPGPSGPVPSVPKQPSAPIGTGPGSPNTPPPGGYAPTPPPTGTPGPGRGNRPGTPRPTPGTGRGGGNTGERAGSRLYGPRPTGGAGQSGGAAARLGGEGAAPKSGANLGAPRATGTGALGGPGATPGAAPPAGSSGSGGRSGMGPMGAGAGRGQSDEDKEHQRASYLQENDPDEAFIGKLGKTAPPVIGQ